MGKLVLLDGRNQLAPRQSGYGQLVLREPLHALRGDHFILRNQSAQNTIGGGVVVHPFARRHRRGDTQRTAALDALRSAANVHQVVTALLHLEPDFAVAPELLAQAGNAPLEAVRDALRSDPAIRVLPDVDTAAACTTNEKWEGLRAAVVDTLTAVHHREPLTPGMEMESLRSRIAPDLSPKLFRAVLDALLADKVIARQDSTIRLPSHRVALRRDEEQLGARAAALIAAGGFTPPDLKQIESALGVPRQRLQAILQQVEREGRVAKIAEGLYFARAPLEQARQLLCDHVAAHGEISAATFRDLLGASRKFSISLLDYFDRTGFTLRVGDIRKLRGSPR